MSGVGDDGVCGAAVLGIGRARLDEMAQCNEFSDDAADLSLAHAALARDPGDGRPCAGAVIAALVGELQ